MRTNSDRAWEMARLLTKVAVRGGAGFLGLAVASGAVITVEALVAARRSYLPADSAPPVEGQFTPSGPQVGSISLTLIGDSTAAGIGTTATTGTVGGHLAVALAARGYKVQLNSVAVSGSRTADLGPQVSRALLGHPEVALILIGANDATHNTSSASIKRNLAEAIRRLEAAGADVVVGTCPDMGAADSLPVPLREIVAWEGRRVARAERTVIEQTKATAVDIGALTGPTIRHDRNRYLSSDRFHPSAEGYALWANALLPAVARAAGAVSATRPSVQR